MWALPVPNCWHSAIMLTLCWWISSRACPRAKSLDLRQAGPIRYYDTNIIGTNNYEDTANSDVVVITSGVPRKPGMSRDDLVLTNMKIVQSVTEQIAKYSPKCILVMVANPLDAMAQLALHVSKFPRNRVMGMSGILDTARFKTFVAMELGCLGRGRLCPDSGRARRPDGAHHSDWLQ